MLDAVLGFADNKVLLFLAPIPARADPCHRWKTLYKAQHKKVYKVEYVHPFWYLS